MYNGQHAMLVCLLECNVQCDMYSVCLAMCSVQCVWLQTMCSLPGAAYSVQYAVFIVNVHSVQSNLLVSSSYQA